MRKSVYILNYTCAVLFYDSTKIHINPLGGFISMDRPMVIRFEEESEKNDAPPEEDDGLFISTIVTYFSRPDHKGRKKRRNRGAVKVRPSEVDLLYV
jgi:hypothetical protein